MHLILHLQAMPLQGSPAPFVTDAIHNHLADKAQRAGLIPYRAPASKRWANSVMRERFLPKSKVPTSDLER